MAVVPIGPIKLFWPRVWILMAGLRLLGEVLTSWNGKMSGATLQWNVFMKIIFWHLSSYIFSEEGWMLISSSMFWLFCFQNLSMIFPKAKDDFCCSPPDGIFSLWESMESEDCENCHSPASSKDSHRERKAVWWWTIEISSGLVKNNQRWEQCKNSWKFFMLLDHPSKICTISHWNSGEMC